MKWMRKHIFWVAGVAVAGTVVWLATTAVTLHSTQPDSVGILFGRSVATADYVKALQAVTHEAIFRYGDRYRQKVSDQNLEEQAWERLIFLSDAKRKGIRVSDREVVTEIRKAPLFQRDGQFDSAGYQAIIQYTLGTTPRVFEEETREALIIQKLIQQVTQTAPVSKKEVHERFLQRESSISVQFLALPNVKAAREVAEACRQQPNNLDWIAKRNRLKLTATDFFKGDGKVPGLEDPSLAFRQMSRLQPGEAGGPFKSGDSWIVARLTKRRPPDEGEFESLRPTLEKELTDQKKFQNYMAWYQDLLIRANPKRKLLRPGR